MRLAREAEERKQDLKPEFEGDIKIIRLNLKLKSLDFYPVFSFIYRRFRLYSQEDQNGYNELTYASNSFTSTIYLRYDFDEEVSVKTYLSFESRNRSSGRSFYEKDGSDNFFKTGLSWSLSF